MYFGFLFFVILTVVYAQTYWTSQIFFLFFGLMLLLADVVAQGILTIIDRTHLIRLFGAIALLLLGLAYTMIWSFWPGETLISIIALIVSCGFFWYWRKNKFRLTSRFWMISLFFVLVLIGAQLKDSTMFCLKFNMDKEHPEAPIAFKHRLAWLYNKEGEKQRAHRFLREEEQYLLKQLYSPLADEEQKQFYQQDLKLVRAALKEYHSGNWKTYKRLQSEVA